MTGVYINLHIPSHPGSGSNKPLLAGRALKILHGAFAELAPSGHAFGIDLPGMDKKAAFSIIRVFSHHRASLDALLSLTCQALASCQILSPDAAPLIKDIDPNYDGPWVICKRFRIASRKSFNLSGATQNARLNTILTAEGRNLPFVSMRSSSNKHVFRLYFERFHTSKPAAFNLPTGGYGLSTSQKSYALPAL